MSVLQVFVIFAGVVSGAALGAVLAYFLRQSVIRCANAKVRSTKELSFFLSVDAEGKCGSAEFERVRPNLESVFGAKSFIVNLLQQKLQTQRFEGALYNKVVEVRASVTYNQKRDDLGLWVVDSDIYVTSSSVCFSFFHTEQQVGLNPIDVRSWFQKLCGKLVRR